MRTGNIIYIMLEREERCVLGGLEGYVCFCVRAG